MLSLLASHKDRIFAVYLAFGLIFGVILYEALGFNYTDELMAIALFGFTVAVSVGEGHIWRLWPLLGLIVLFGFYEAYSILIHSNTLGATLNDSFTQLKPFLGFFSAYILASQLKSADYKWLMVLGLLVAAFLLILGLVDTKFVFFVHYSRFATGVICTFFLLMLCSNLSWRDCLLLLVVLSIGFFSQRAKFYGFWLVSVILLIYYKIKGNLRFGWQTFSLLILLVAAAVWIARDKIMLYYVDGMMNSREMWSRPAMMLTSLQILLDYFPFGSGFATFGSFASATSYSHIYADYGLDGLWGLTRENPEFVCDSYYPVLAQMGVVGVLLYVGFWMWVLRKSSRTSRPKTQLMVWLIFLFFLIEGVADTTMTHNRGLFVMIILGYVLQVRCEKDSENKTMTK